MSMQVMSMDALYATKFRKKAKQYSTFHTIITSRQISASEIICNILHCAFQPTTRDTASKWQ